MTHPYREELAGRLAAAAEQKITRYFGDLDGAIVSHDLLREAAAALRQSPTVEEVASRTCHCRNVEFGSYEAQIELVPPDFLRRDDGRGICVDVCLALEVSQLWRLGIRTTGSCCGHGKLEPTICVADESVPAMRSLGYTASTLTPDRPDIFTAKTGWPASGRGG